jgi:hypothetical protein
MVEGIQLSQQVNYGKIGFKIQDAERLGKFSLEKNVNVAYSLFQVFDFHVFKQIQRGDTIVRANVFGYVFTNPMKGLINYACNAENDYPHCNDFKDPLMRECVRMIDDKAFEDKPLQGQTLIAPEMIPTEKLQKDVFNWITQNLIVAKKYTIQSAQGYDSGVREAKFMFKKKDFQKFGSVGVFAVPLFHLSYQIANSTKSFKRDVLGYSGEIIHDDIKCSKTKMFGKECENFPDNVCSACGNLICNEHQKQCEKCGVLLCKDCAVSKGLISKHYFCSKCT